MGTSGLWEACEGHCGTFNLSFVYALMLAWLGFQPDNRVLEQLQMKGTDRVRDADRGLLDEIARYLDEDDDFDEVEELMCGARAGLSRNTPSPPASRHMKHIFMPSRRRARPHAPTPHDK